MTYNPKTHLLRPLEPGEIIEADDMHAHVFGYMRPVPVPVTTGWRPRSEAHLIQEAPKGSEVAWKGPALVETFPFNVTPGQVWTHFYIIPPCDLPPPDPERERFEKWIASRGFNIEREPDGEYRYETARNSWDAWQAAARKENV